MVLLALYYNTVLYIRKYWRELNLAIMYPNKLHLGKFRPAIYVAFSYSAAVLGLHQPITLETCRKIVNHYEGAASLCSWHQLDIESYHELILCQLPEARATDDTNLRTNLGPMQEMVSNRQ